MPQAANALNPIQTSPVSAIATDATPRASATPTESEPRLRLSIEEYSQGFVYRFIDEITGDIVKQYPREQIVQLSKNTDYAAGALFKVTA